MPTLVVAAALLLAYLLVNYDFRADNSWVKQYPPLFGACAPVARGTLSTLAQVPSQYPSRLPRNFMRAQATAEKTIAPATG